MISLHGVGGAQDLPIPAPYLVGGAGAALSISFAVLMLAWRKPRFGAITGHPLPAVLTRVVDSRVTACVLRSLGLIIAAYVVWAAYFGADRATNPAFGVIYIWLWVGIVPLSLLFGPFWRAVSPTRSIARAINSVSPRDGFPRLPDGVGYWPAAVALLAFVWLELVYPENATLTSLQVAIAMYGVVLIVGGVVFGNEWSRRADPFEVYSTIIGHLAPVARNESGQLVFVSPLRHLHQLRAEPGLVPVVAVLLGSTAFDSFSNSIGWVRFEQSTTSNVTLVNTALLVGFCLFVVVTFSAATMATGVGPKAPRSALPGLFAHSLVPIIVGYMVAHYVTLLLEGGQQTLIYLSDPMGTGANLLGTGNWEVSYFLSAHPTFLACLKVAAILIGHVVGVVAAHDRAMQVLPKRHELLGQFGLLFVMVIYTVGGLFLLFNS